MAVATKIYPTSADTIPQPVTFAVLLDTAGTILFVRFLWVSVFVSTGPGQGSDEYSFLGLPSVSGGLFYTASTPLLDEQQYYIRIEGEYESSHPASPFSFKAGGPTNFDGEDWDSFLTEAGGPEKTTNPTPTDTATGISLYPNLIWEAG